MINFKYNNFLTGDQPVDTIEIFGDIGENFFGDGMTIDKFSDMLKNAKSPVLDIQINSPGGDVNTALTIRDLIKLHKAKVKKATILGMAASSGTIIATGADTIEMSNSAVWLIHRVSGYAVGTVEDIRKQADEQAKFDEILVNIYKEKTKKSKEKIKELMIEDTWLTAKEALKWGFVDKIINTTEMLNTKQIITDFENYNRKMNTNLNFNKKMTTETENKVPETQSGGDLQATMKNQISILTAQNEEFKVLNESLKTQLEFARNAVQDQQTLGADYLNLKEQFDAQAREIRAFKAQIADLQEEMTAKETAIKSKENTIKSYEDQVTAALKDNATLRARLSQPNASHGQKLGSDYGVAPEKKESEMLKNIKAKVKELGIK